MPERPSPIDIHVGNRVRTLRMARHLSQSEVGDALGVTFQQVQKYERGTNRISASKLHKLAEILGVAPEYFFQGLDGGQELSTPDYAMELVSHPETLALMKAFQRIEDRKLRRKIIEMLEALSVPFKKRCLTKAVEDRSCLCSIEK